MASVALPINAYCLLCFARLQHSEIKIQITQTSKNFVKDYTKRNY